MNAAIGRMVRAASIVGVMAVGVLGPASAAQETADSPHPAHIHSGSCAQLGDVVVSLKDVAEPVGDHSGAGSAFSLETSETIVDVPLQDLLDGNHAVNVHKSADEIDTYIACG